MNWLKSGPQLKLPTKLKGGSPKVPPALSDLFYDLRDRRLLPLLALVVVAIAAVPFLLGGGSDQEADSGAKSAVAVSPNAGASRADSSRLTVVRAEPGLREYRKRLAKREPTDPFEQRYATPDVKGAELQSESTSSSGTTFTTTSESTTTESSPSNGSSGSPSNGSSGNGGGSAPDSKVILFGFAIDVRISKSGGNDAPSNQKGEEPTVKHRVLPLTPLPGEKAPVVTYMGPSKKDNVLFLVSSEVRSVFGESKCVSGDGACQLLEVEPTFPTTFVYGANEVRYTINVLKIEPVVTGHS